MLRVTFGNQRGRKVFDRNGKFSTSITPGNYVVGKPCYAIVVQRPHVPEWRAMWYFDNEADARARVQDAIDFHNSQGLPYSLTGITVAEGRVFEDSDDDRYAKPRGKRTDSDVAGVCQACFTVHAGECP